MRRALASLLLFAVSFPLIGAPALASFEDNLPSCCRRDGKHHCSESMDEDAGGGGVTLRAISGRCANYPQSTATSAGGGAAMLKASARIFAAIISHPSAHFQTQALYRISFTRSCQKRGPPSLLF